MEMFTQRHGEGGESEGVAGAEFAKHNFKIRTKWRCSHKDSYVATVGEGGGEGEGGGGRGGGGAEVTKQL